MEQFDTAFDHTIYVEPQDAGNYQIAEFKLNPLVQAMCDWNNQGDKFTFTVLTQDEVFVMTPTNFQLGWQGSSNGQALKLFPANYIFIGFRLPAGEHHIELNFEPPDDIIRIDGELCTARSGFPAFHGGQAIPARRGAATVVAA